MKNVNKLLLILIIGFLYLQVEAQRYEVTDYLGSQGSSSAQLNSPYGIAIDSRGNMWVANNGGHNIVYYDGSQFKLALGAANQAGYQGGVGVSTRFSNPKGLHIMERGGKEILVVADAGNDVVRFIDISNISSLSTNTGDDIAGLDDPSGLASDASGNLYIADRMNYVVKKVDVSGNVSVFAGQSGQSGSADGNATSAATFTQPTGVYVDGNDVYVADAGSIRKISGGTVSTLNIGADYDNWSWDMGELFNTTDLAKIDSRWFISDNCTVRRLDDGSSYFQTAVGSNYANDCGYATNEKDTFAKFQNISQIIYDNNSEALYVTDMGNHLIRKIEYSGVGIKEDKRLKSLTVFPNPANGSCYLNGLSKLKGEQLTVSLIDLTGKVLHHQEHVVKSDNLRINLGSLTSGLYMVQISGGDRMTTRKLYVK